jgi:hypothetical protein
MIPPVIVKDPVGELVIMADVRPLGFACSFIYFLVINPRDICIAEINVVLCQQEIVVPQNFSHAFCLRRVFILNVFF